ncbi:MAG: hypothetical protein IKU37_10285 [Candidatus Gastranaerophilales bacterium]|nr:hypothetical protein [Candidatus Gastranaerophilales bacterium]
MCGLETLGIYKQISFRKNHKAASVYLMGYYGNIQLIETSELMAEKLGVKNCNTTYLRHKKFHVMNGYSYLFACDAKNQNSNGTISLEKEELQKMSEVFSDAYSMPVYSINCLGELIRYNNAREAQEQLGLTRIYTHGTRNSSKNLYFIPANDIEIRDENAQIVFDKNGRPKIDYSKLDKFIESMPESGNFPVFVVDFSGKATYVESLDHITCVSKNTLLKCIKEERPMQNGYLILKARLYVKRNDAHLAQRDENGDLIADEEKIRKTAKEKFNKGRVSVVKLTNLQTNETIEFYSTGEAARFLGVTKQAINYSNKHKVPCRGHRVIY